uniref:uncharacterized protein LOC120332966 n=1 Tax=Styela clava TaxID=7725 RepID=UPI001939DBC5|nr:uncharacterized protein LOC120332966 [Styela clava]
MKILGLPCGKQRGIHGPAVNVPSKLHVVCDQFPRLPSECQLIPLKLKRKLSYTSHYLYDYVRIDKVICALKWLKINNFLYKDIIINDNYIEHASKNDEELWNAMFIDLNDDMQLNSNESVKNIPVAPDIQTTCASRHSSDSEKKRSSTNSSSTNVSYSPTCTGSVSSRNLWNTSQTQGMKMINVPSDGNCLIGQQHYVVFEPESQYSDSNTDSYSKMELMDISHKIQRCKVTKSNSPEISSAVIENKEDEIDLKHSTSVRGLQYESTVVNDDISNKIISMAPAEDEKPIPLLADDKFEQLAYPSLYPDGNNGFSTDRVVPITPQCLYKDVLLSPAQPLGHITDYVIRIEFQARGSPHAHMLLWVDKAPKLGIQTDEEVCAFISKHVACSFPVDDLPLKALVQDLQTHSHSSYCRKSGGCRFNYPKPPSEKVIIAKEVEEDESKLMTQSKIVLKKVRDTLSSSYRDTSSDVSMDDLLQNIDNQQYRQALCMSQKGNTVILARKPAECFINAYNPVILKAWQANMDIQYVVDPYACVMYVASYMMKSEQGMGLLLKHACKEYKDFDIKNMPRRISSVFLNNRELSTQEACYRILSIPMKKMSRSVIYINTDPVAERQCILKSKKELEKLEDEDSDIFQKNILDRYSARPSSLDNVCLATFVANYAVSYRKNDKHVDDSVKDLLHDDHGNKDLHYDLPQHIVLRRGLGKMSKRRRECIIRFRKHNKETDFNNFCRAKLMLYLPWRSEERDLLADHPTYSSYYLEIQDKLSAVESRYCNNVELVDSSVHKNSVSGPPLHLWGDLGMESDLSNQQDKSEGDTPYTTMIREDLAANSAIIESVERVAVPKSDIGARYKIEKNRNVLSTSEYCNMIRCLNEKQKAIVFHHRKWCKDAVIAIKQNGSVEPYRIFLSGPGGVGKSHVIKLIQHDTRRYFALSRTVDPNDVTYLLCAPTGVAAFNIDGITIHFALLLTNRKASSGHDGISFEKLNTLRSHLGRLRVLIIDEISMVSSDMLLNIHKRLQVIKGNAAPFGNVSVLAVGDLFQLPPVCQPQIFCPVSDETMRLGRSLWNDYFHWHELDEIMRQKNDRNFAELLCRIRLGNQTRADIDTLRTREIHLSDLNYPEEALHVFAYNNDVDNWNLFKLNKLIQSGPEKIVIPAIDDKREGLSLISLRASGLKLKRCKTGGLHTVLEIAVGCRVMLLYNIDTSDGLVNGVMGTVQYIAKNDKEFVISILIKFDNDNVGRKAMAKSRWKRQHPLLVPITRREAKFEKAYGKGAQVSRYQFPLTLGWAVTIHKCQGITLNKIVVNTKGKKFGCGQVYVALSRVRKLENLYLTDFDPCTIRCSSEVMNNMRTMPIAHQRPPTLTDLNKSNWLTIGHLNIRYFLKKMDGIVSYTEGEIFRHADICCFTETYLTERHNIDKFTNKFDYVSFREDVPSEQNHGGKHGLLVCASRKLNPVEIKTSSNVLEHKMIRLKTSTNKEFTLLLIYRPPSFPQLEFLNILSELMTFIPQGAPTFILGDFNDNIFHNRSSSIMEKMNELGFRQYIPTNRATTDYGSLLDHMYFNRNCTDDSIVVDIVDTYYSDHDTVFITTNYLTT